VKYDVAKKNKIFRAEEVNEETHNIIKMCGSATQLMQEMYMKRIIQQQVSLTKH
jgi:hypothetical protein